MIELYVAALILGGGLALTGAIGAVVGHSADTGGDADASAHGDLGDVHSSDAEAAGSGLDTHISHADVAHGDLADGSHHSHDADVGHGALEALSAVLPVLSLRFWTYALATFGLIGLALSWATDTGRTAVLVVAIVLGLLVGRVTHAVFRAARRLETTGAGSSDQFVGRDAVVLVPVTPNSTGKVTLHLASGTVELLADPFSTETLAAGTTVVVVAFRADRALVMSREQFHLPAAPPIPGSLPGDGSTERTS